MSIKPQNTPMPPLEAYSHKPRTCDKLGHGVYHFAPGVIEGVPAKPPLLRRWVVVGCIAAVVLASCAYVGYLSIFVGGAL